MSTRAAKVGGARLGSMKRETQLDAPDTEQQCTCDADHDECPIAPCDHVESPVEVMGAFRRGAGYSRPLLKRRFVASIASSKNGDSTKNAPIPTETMMWRRETFSSSSNG